MKNIHNYYVFLFFSFILILPLKLKAQENFLPIALPDLSGKNQTIALNSTRQFEKESLSLLKMIRNQKKSFEQNYHMIFAIHNITEKNISQQLHQYNNVLLSLKKPQSSMLLIEKVVYTTDNSTWIESFTYNDKSKKLTHLRKYKPNSGSKWEDDIRFTYTYDNKSNRLSELSEYWHKNNWINLILNTFSYDETGNILTRSNDGWNRNTHQWEVNVKTKYTYDEKNNPIKAVSEAWYPDLNQLLPFERQTYTYDGKNLILSVLIEEYEDSEVWISDRRRTYIYDNTGNLLNEFQEYWNDNSDTWVNKKRTNYIYDNNNMLSKLIEKWEDYLAAWVYYHRYTYTYDDKNNLQTDLFEYWDDVEEQLVNGERNTYTYKNNMLVTTINEYWYSDNEQWIINLRFTNTYDANENLQVALMELWESEKWVNYYRNTYSYDGSGNITDFTSGSWNSLDSIWNPSGGNCDIINNGNFYRFSCEELSANYISLLSSVKSNNNIIAKFSLKQNYPNPFNPVTTISYIIPERTNVNIAIYNTLGEVITTLINKKQIQGKYKIKFNASHLPSGIYFYKIITDNYSNTKKMVLIK